MWSKLNRAQFGPVWGRNGNEGKKGEQLQRRAVRRRNWAHRGLMSPRQEQGSPFSPSLHGADKKRYNGRTES